MTQFWCPTCGTYRQNYVDHADRLRGVECGHLLDDPHRQEDDDR